jgi:hypothetical protein
LYDIFMTAIDSRPFQILALSGGGYRGLYTAKIIADIEKHIDAPFASRFDLLAGTSVGGILAMALALEIPAAEIVELFECHGNEIFKKRLSLRGLMRSPYSPRSLRRLLEDPSLFGDRLLGACKHPVVVPSFNYSKGEPVVFKTPHHEKLVLDHTRRIVDIALSTSAAPAYFPRHVFDNCQYVDGGVYANAPGLIGLHEAMEFFDLPTKQIRMVAIGTMSARYTVNPKANRDGGLLVDWGGWNPFKMARPLFGLTISAQEIVTNYMLKHRLGDDNYYHVDDEPRDQSARAIDLDTTDRYAREVLLGMASERSKACLGSPRFQTFLRHDPGKPIFFHGENAA